VRNVDFYVGDLSSISLGKRDMVAETTQTGGDDTGDHDDGDDELCAVELLSQVLGFEGGWRRGV